MRRLIIGISGSSGVIYGIRLLEVLRGLPEIETHLVMSTTAKMNISLETDHNVAAVESLADVVHRTQDLAAPIASGSFRTEGMVVAPCSIKTLSGIVNSYADNLLIRAADVVLKEGRKLVLMPRESPLHAGHCELLLRAARLGIALAPPLPVFYTRPRTLEDVIDNSVGRVLDLFGIDTGLVQPWQGPQQARDH